jgi:hypothetical protein
LQNLSTSQPTPKCKQSTTRHDSKEQDALQKASGKISDIMGNAKSGSVNSSRHPTEKPRNKGPRRVGRAAWDAQSDDYLYNDDTQLKKLLKVLSGKSKYDHQNDIDLLRAVTKLSTREIVEDNDDGSEDDTIAWMGGDRLTKRQPLDRLDAPSRWRQILKPKLGRAIFRRQPLDRLDEPNSWRDRIVPKLMGMADKRQPLDRLDEPSRWRSRMVPKYMQFRVNKRQPLDRIDEPIYWKNTISTKLNRIGKRLSYDDDEDDAASAEDWSRDLEKRQPLDRVIDAPSEWKDKLIPKLMIEPDKRPDLIE